MPCVFCGQQLCGVVKGPFARGHSRMRKEKMDVKSMHDRGQRADGAADPAALDQPSDIY